MTSIRCLHGGVEHAHTSVADVRKCQGAVATHIAQQYGAPSAEERAWYDNNVAGQTTPIMQREREAPGALTDAPASEEGLYLVDDKVYKVQRSKASGHLYAKVALKEQVPAENGYPEEDPFWRWTYAKGAIKNILEKHKMGPDHAAAFGLVTHHCVNCLKELTRGESKRRGYGPTCAKNHGWPYDHDSKD